MAETLIKALFVTAKRKGRNGCSPMDKQPVIHLSSEPYLAITLMQDMRASQYV